MSHTAYQDDHRGVVAHTRRRTALSCGAPVASTWRDYAQSDALSDRLGDSTEATLCETIILALPGWPLRASEPHATAVDVERCPNKMPCPTIRTKKRTTCVHGQEPAGLNKVEAGPRPPA